MIAPRTLLLVALVAASGCKPDLSRRMPDRNYTGPEITHLDIHLGRGSLEEVSHATGGRYGDCRDLGLSKLGASTGVASEAAPSQVRWTCGLPNNERLLIVFDDPTAAARMVSRRRNYDDRSEALADFRRTTDALTEIFGAPAKPGVAPGEQQWPEYRPYRSEWSGSDSHPAIVARAVAVRMGERYTVTELVEISLNPK
ncbi:MAG: hypothetical protein ACI9WU_003949 [Myxococcota bacterium]|jgi:hypothetical protein